MSEYTRHRAILFFLSLLVIFNFVDAMSTMILFERNLISEGNPIMAYLIKEDAFLFMLGKLSLVYTGVGILYATKTRDVSLYGSIALCGVYLYILFKHAWIILLV